MNKAKIGVIGCGNICGTYLQCSKGFDILDVVACADLVMDRAKLKASEHGVPTACSVEQLLSDPEIEIVLNLTIPRAHAAVALSVINAGKSVYNEKPLALTRDEGHKIIQAAKDKGVRVGCAPDTFFGGGLQTCIKLINDGWIGQPVGATAFMMCHGHEGWHPDPEFFYKPGGGPMFDMGPYYLTALITMLGPIRRVTGCTRTTFPERVITSQPKHGTTITVEVPTHVTGIMEFANGAIGTIITSFDVWGTGLPRIEIYGTEGTLRVPDPNTFGGPVQICRAGAKELCDIPLSHGYIEQNRSIGAADMAYALRSDRPHRANGEMGFHVLDVMHAIHEACKQGKHIELQSTCSRPTPLPLGLRQGLLDE